MSRETNYRDTEELNARVVFLVPKNHAKTVKSALERAGQLDGSSKILPESNDNVGGFVAAETHTFAHEGVTANLGMPTSQTSGTQTKITPLRFEHDVAKGEHAQPSKESATQPAHKDGFQQQRMRIPTTIPYSAEIGHARADLYGGNGHKFKSAILQDLHLEHLLPDITIGRQVTGADLPRSSAIRSPVHKALQEALSALQESVLASMALSPEALVAAFPDGYSIYKPMLLLPHNAFASAPWKSLVSKHGVDSEMLAPVWQRTAAAVGATHVAINSPIPPETDPNPDTDPNAKQHEENILRRPANLVPIHGDFGPRPTPRTMSCPTPADFEQALWVTAKQNGIWQVWAPLYTMFSRGNIREKTRILNLPSVATDFDVPSAAADLYAGIGYFAFSYKKRGEDFSNGIRRVVCWELNPWSVEGLRRGTEKNGWTCKIIKGDDVSQLQRAGTKAEDGSPWAARNAAAAQQADFWVFQASNEGAESDYASMCSSLGLVGRLPVRHVNLGLLPTSRLSWSVAVGMLDEHRGGWIHVHENIGIKDVESRSREIEGQIADLVQHGNDGADKMAVKVEHVEWVKMYAPGVVHCVLDVHVQRKR